MLTGNPIGDRALPVLPGVERYVLPPHGLAQNYGDQGRDRVVPGLVER
jgi:hypothetical protein